jgi:hypothetical protein
MLLSIDGFYINCVNYTYEDNDPPSTVSATYPTDGNPFPPGQSAYASIALSFYSTMLGTVYRDRDPHARVIAVIDSWTVYNPDGTQSAPIQGRPLTQNTVRIDNCATITFSLTTMRAGAMAQVTVFVFG